MSSQSGESGPPTRRHFLYAVGGTAATALGGWVLLRTAGLVGVEDSAAFDVPAPRLRSGIAIVPSASGAELYDTALLVRDPVCGVNHLGSFVLTQMDGRRSVADIARGLAARNPGPADFEAVEATTAKFLAELGMAGVLASPFRVMIHACEMSA